MARLSVYNRIRKKMESERRSLAGIKSGTGVPPVPLFNSRAPKKIETRPAKPNVAEANDPEFPPSKKTNRPWPRADLGSWEPWGTRLP